MTLPKETDWGPRSVLLIIVLGAMLGASEGVMAGASLGTLLGAA
jgi:hypothetical protein